MAINREKIIREMSNIRVEGDDEGLIPALGVYVQQFPADFWNELSLRMISSETGTVLREIEKMLVVVFPIPWGCITLSHDEPAGS